MIAVADVGDEAGGGVDEDVAVWGGTRGGRGRRGRW